MSKYNIHSDPAPSMCKATLYFGASIPAYEGQNDFEVTDADFAKYLEGYITPQFPGFTVMLQEGYWKGKSEKVRLLTILAPDAGQFRNVIRGFAEVYKTAFNQEAVAYDFTPCQFALDCWPFGPVKSYHKPAKGY